MNQHIVEVVITFNQYYQHNKLLLDGTILIYRKQ